jgi:hypothetical protein
MNYLRLRVYIILLKGVKMGVNNLRQNLAYALTDPLLSVFPSPIVAFRAPGNNDIAQIGQQWTDSQNNTIYFLTSVVANVPTWTVAAAGGGGVNSVVTDAGTAVPAANSITIHGGSNINTSGAGHTVTVNLNNSVAVSGSLTAGTTVTAGTTITATGGNIVATVGNITAGAVITAGTGLTVSNFTAGVVQSNAAGVFSSTNGSNGQVLIGGGAAPIWTTITAGNNIIVTNAANSITIATTGALDLNYTAVTTTPYVVLGTDDFLGVDSSSLAITVELPNAPAVGRVFVIKDSSGNAATNNITVTTVGGAVLLDGATSYVITTDYQSIQVMFNGTFYEIY